MTDRYKHVTLTMTTYSYKNINYNTYNTQNMLTTHPILPLLQISNYSNHNIIQ